MRPILHLSAPIAILLATLAGCAPRNQYAPPPPPVVDVAPPVKQDVTEYFEATGTTEPSAVVELRARINGYLKEIHFKDGQMVKQGDLLFVIEPEPFEVELKSAQANLRKTEATLKLAELDVERAQTLAGRGATTKQEVDTRIANRDSAAADEAAAEAAVRRAELDLDYTKIYAPLTGRIGRHLLDIGNLVQAELSILARIEAVDPIYVYFNISETDLLRFTEMRLAGTLPDIEKNPPTIMLGLQNEDGFPHQGHLDFAETSADAGTGTIVRRAIFPNTEGAIVGGLFAKLRAAIGPPQQRILVPERAIGTDQRGKYVLVVNGDDVVQQRPVKLGPVVNGLVVVLSGVEPNERVVVNGLLRARPGSKVTPKAVTIEAPPNAAVVEGDSEPPPTTEQIEAEAKAAAESPAAETPTAP